MRQVLVRKRRRHDPPDDDLAGTTPEQRLGMMWQLALDAWAFKEGLDAEPRLQRHVVVLNRGDARTGD